MIEHLFADIESHRDALISLRRDLHAHPELAFKEVRTTEIVAARLKAVGLEVRTGVAEQAVGAGRVLEVAPTTGSDDMAYFLERAPGCYFVVGSHNRARGLDCPHHNQRFDFDEEALPVAAKVLGGAALRLLGEVKA